MGTESSHPLPETCEALLARMVQYNTINRHFGGVAGAESMLQRELARIAKGWNLRTRWLEVPEGGENLLVTHEVSPEAPWLLFESHVDTVGVEGMTVEPLVMKAEEERLYGRGTCDTKGSGAAMLWALRDYAANGGGPHNVGLLFALDEEARMSGARGFAANGLAEFLPRLRGMIVGEPTLLRPVVAHNGSIRWLTMTRGVAAHSSVPANGRSAISSMMRVVDALESRYSPTVTGEHPLTGRAAFSINVIRGGTQVNIIPEYCEIDCDRRTVPGEETAVVLAARDAVLTGHEVEHRGLYVVPPLGEERSVSLLAALQPILAAHGIDPAPCGAPYVTDASHYHAAGAPTIVIGPGALEQAHTKDEWVSRRQLKLAVGIYAELMRAPL